MTLQNMDFSSVVSETLQKSRSERDDDADQNTPKVTLNSVSEADSVLEKIENLAVEDDKKLPIPYHEICRKRYKDNQKKYEDQFIYELRMLESMQPTAYEAIRFNRHFVVTTVWPPLHTRKQVERFVREFYKLSPKKQARLNYLLKEDQY